MRDGISKHFRNREGTSARNHLCGQTIRPEDIAEHGAAVEREALDSGSDTADCHRRMYGSDACHMTDCQGYSVPGWQCCVSLLCRREQLRKLEFWHCGLSGQIFF